MRRLPPPLTGCTVRSACIPHQALAHRFGCSCRDHLRSRVRRNTQRCSRRRNRRRLRCGSSSTDHRRHSRCRRRPSLRRSGCTDWTTCTAPREQVHPTSSFPMKCRHKCHSRRRDSHSIGRRSSKCRRNCGNNCARHRQLCRCWRRRPIHRSGYIRWSPCTRPRAPAHLCLHRHRMCRSGRPPRHSSGSPRCTRLRRCGSN